MKIQVMGFETRAIRVLRQNKSLKNSVGSKFRNGIISTNTSVGYTKAEKELKPYPQADKKRRNLIAVSLLYFIAIISSVVVLSSVLFSVI